jgi:methylglutaconyl-CoA hydratase
VHELLQAGPRAIAEAKALLREVTARRPEDVREATVERLASVRSSPEGQEGLRAFLERGTPDWIAARGRFEGGS